MTHQEYCEFSDVLHRVFASLESMIALKGLMQANTKDWRVKNKERALAYLSNNL